MKQYLELMHKVVCCGEPCKDRTGVGTLSIFGEVLKFDLRDGFPAVTTKRLAFKTMAAELSMFVRGIADLKYLHSHGCHIWDANGATYKGAKFEGDLGKIYGAQWRNFGGVDQLKQLVEGLKSNPDGRRHVVTAWNPPELDEMCLPPCHIFFQCRVYRGELDVAVYLRSLDMFLGAPFDIASYALLAHLIAYECKLRPRVLTMFIGDAHIYNNHMAQVNTQLAREPVDLPVLKLDPKTSLFSFEPCEAELVSYNPYPPIPAKMAV